MSPDFTQAKSRLVKTLWDYCVIPYEGVASSEKLKSPCDLFFLSPDFNQAPSRVVKFETKKTISDADGFSAWR
ncbi:MAG: hypothetical protein R2852_03045 [Bacteroidia bacterium]